MFEDTNVLTNVLINVLITAVFYSLRFCRRVLAYTYQMHILSRMLPCYFKKFSIHQFVSVLLFKMT